MHLRKYNTTDKSIHVTLNERVTRALPSWKNKTCDLIKTMRKRIWLARNFSLDNYLLFSLIIK